MDSIVNINWNKVTPCLILLVLELVSECMFYFSVMNSCVFSEETSVFNGDGIVTDGATPAEVNKHLELGRDFLARGQLSDALTQYHAAVG